MERIYAGEKPCIAISCKFPSIPEVYISREITLALLIWVRNYDVICQTYQEDNANEKSDLLMACSGLDSMCSVHLHSTLHT